MTEVVERSSDTSTVLSFQPSGTEVEAIIRALAPDQPAFVYERASTRDRSAERACIGVGGEVISNVNGDVFDALRAEVSRTGGPDTLAAFLSYEALRGEPLAHGPRQLFIRPAALIEVDFQAGAVTLSGRHEGLLEKVRTALSGEVGSTGGEGDSSLEDLARWTLDRSEAEFIQTAGALKRELSARPEVVGAVLSVQVSCRTSVSPLEAYLALRGLNPSTCMFFVQHGDFALWGATSLPVMQIRGTRLVAETDGATRKVDPGDEREWTPTDKEAAEYDLVVSALRADLDGVLVPGSLRFIADREARQYFNLQHLFAEVEGELAPGVDPGEALRRLTPHGAATGYSKAGAMALIDRFDARPRGPYAGAVGVFGRDGSADAACVIRSAWKSGGVIRTRAGAKIVADSDPAAEYRESVMKTLPLRRCVARARA